MYKQNPRIRIAITIVSDELTVACATCGHASTWNLPTDITDIPASKYVIANECDYCHCETRVVYDVDIIVCSPLLAPWHAIVTYARNVWRRLKRIIKRENSED